MVNRDGVNSEKQFCDVLTFSKSREKKKQEGHADNFQGFPQREVIPFDCLIHRKLSFQFLKYQKVFICAHLFY